MFLSADCMMQTYQGNTALSSPGEEIVHHRKGGWFLTYKKILSFTALIVIAVIVAGVIGWNIGTMPKTRVSDDYIAKSINCATHYRDNKLFLKSCTFVFLLIRRTIP